MSSEAPLAHATLVEEVSILRRYDGCWEWRARVDGKANTQFADSRELAWTEAMTWMQTTRGERPDGPSDLDELRGYLAAVHGTDYGASDDALSTLLERADAYVAAGGEGGQYWLVGGWLREARLGPENDGKAA